MWRSALLTAILFSGHLATHAQEVLPLFGEHTRMWTSERNGSYNGYCLDTWRSTNWIGGDTVINGATYTVLHARERHYVTPIIDPCNEMQEYALPNIYVREADGEVYALNPSQTAEYLVYDFNASVGDSVPSPSSAGNDWDMSGWATVLDEDSVLIDGGYRQRWNVNSLWNGLDTVWIIEGIGSTTGLFNPLVYTDFETSFLLDCVREHDMTILSQYGCEVITGIHGAEARSIVPPFPVPNYGEVTLDDRVTRAEVLSMEGRLLFAGPCISHVLHVESPGPVIVRGFDKAGVLIGHWLLTVLQH